jgi:hypothetical protein
VIFLAGSGASQEWLYYLYLRTTLAVIGFKRHKAPDETDGFFPTGEINFFIRLDVADRTTVRRMVLLASSSAIDYKTDHKG